jgi:hypothetical protein
MSEQTDCAHRKRKPPKLENKGSLITCKHNAQDVCLGALWYAEGHGCYDPTHGRVDVTKEAASPVVHEWGMLPYRIVIRDLGDQHVVHTEVLEPGKEPWYHQGDYFTKRGDAPTALESDAAALRKAWARFEERARRSPRMESPPAKRLAEVADIAESIINALLPEDEDERRELIGDDYQLESDIETFEQLTGKVIQPRDDEPILCDEIELEDIERWA